MINKATELKFHTGMGIILEKRSWFLVKNKRTVLKIFLLVAALGLLAGAGIYLYLKKDALLEQVVENGVTDTTEEKGMNISETFQVYKNRLYCNLEKGFGFVDLKTGKRENLTSEYIYNFVICDELIYYLDTRRAVDCLVCKNLKDVAGKEWLRVLRDIESYIFINKEVIALRELEDKHVIIKYGEDGSEQVLLEFGVDVMEQYEAQLCGYYEGKYIFFSNRAIGGGVYMIDESTGEVRKVFSIENEGSVYCKLAGVKCAKDKVYIWGIACDSAKSTLGGQYYMENSTKTGVWQVNLTDFKAERILDEFYDEMCILQGELYGVEETILQKLQVLQVFQMKKLNPVNSIES
mgnify:CR=1 FL=1